MMLRSTWLSAAKLTTASIACLRISSSIGRAVADVGAHEHVPRVALQVAQVLQVAGVGQRVDVDDQVARAARGAPGARTHEPMNPAPPVTSRFMIYPQDIP